MVSTIELTNIQTFKYVYLLIQTRKLANNIKVMGQSETVAINTCLRERDRVIQIEGTYFYIGNKQLVEIIWIFQYECYTFKRILILIQVMLWFKITQLLSVFTKLNGKLAKFVLPKFQVNNTRLFVIKL